MRRKEKISCRLPFLAIQPGRLGVRRLPESRTGNSTELRVARRTRRARGTARMGAETRGDFDLSEVVCDGGEPGVCGGVLRTETRRGASGRGVEREAGGGVRGAGERVFLGGQGCRAHRTSYLNCFSRLQAIGRLRLVH